VGKATRPCTSNTLHYDFRPKKLAGTALYSVAPPPFFAIQLLPQNSSTPQSQTSTKQHPFHTPLQLQLQLPTASLQPDPSTITPSDLILDASLLSPAIYPHRIDPESSLPSPITSFRPTPLSCLDHNHDYNSNHHQPPQPTTTIPVPIKIPPLLQLIAASSRLSFFSFFSPQHSSPAVALDPSSRGVLPPFTVQ
jgi:hypothetical protein